VHRWRDGRGGNLRGVRQLTARDEGKPNAQRNELIAVAVITAFGFLVRLVALRQPMRYDEAVTWVLFSGRSWDTIVSWYPFPNNHVLFSLLGKASGNLAPFQPWAFRLPAFLAGVAIVPLTWLVGRRLAGRDTALLGAALCAGSMPLVLYSTNGRGYTLVVVFSLLLILVADRLRTRGTWWWGWVAFSLLAALGLYTVPVMVYPIGAVSLWLALDALWAGREVAVRRLLAIIASGTAALLIAGLLYLPIIRAAGVQAIIGNKLAQPISWSVFGQLIPGFVYQILTTWNSPLPWWMVPVTGCFAYFGLQRTDSSRRASLALATMVWCVGLFVLSHREPFARFWLFALPLFLLAVARGLTRLELPPRWRLRTDTAWHALVLAALMSVLALTTRAAEMSDDTGTFRPARAVAEALAKELRAGDRVLAPIPNNAPLLYYFGERGLDTTLLNVPLSASRRAFLVLNPERGQTLEWAVLTGVIDPKVFVGPRLLLGLPDAEVWRTERR
jgi:4-amino-4-deoxy-L-arabinose transferase-like glycosyltransferase